MDRVLTLHPVAPGSIISVSEDLFLTEIYSRDVGAIH